MVSEHLKKYIANKYWTVYKGLPWAYLHSEYLRSCNQLLSSAEGKVKVTWMRSASEGKNSSHEIKEVSKRPEAK